METIGNFELRRVLGRGGAATVYEARDPARGGRVALKVVAEKLAPSPALRARFLREAQLASDLAHPNLVHVVETGEHRGRPYVAMELVEGVDLERVMRSGRPFPVEWTVDVLRQVCEGLHRAHVSGLVHGDLKPSDVRVNSEGIVKIVDFGVAALKPDDRGDDGRLLSGVHYRAPELIEGRRPDARSDVFSVGAIFYELLASRKPFPADTVTGVMFRIRHEDADPAALPPTDFSPGLEAVVVKALRRARAERYSSLEELREDLVELVKEIAPRLAARKAGLPPEAAEEAPAEAPAEAPPEGASLHNALARAREKGESDLALAIVRRLLDIDPDDARARAVAEEIEALGREAEAEQLCAIALAYAADGEMEKAAEIAEKIERLSPWSPRYLQLQVYLDEEAARLDSEGLAATAKEQLDKGDLVAARAAAEGALALFPLHRLALEVRDRAQAGLAALDSELGRDLEGALQEGAFSDPAPPSGSSMALESATSVEVEGSAGEAAPLEPPDAAEPRDVHPAAGRPTCPRRGRRGTGRRRGARRSGGGCASPRSGRRSCPLRRHRKAHECGPRPVPARRPPGRAAGRHHGPGARPRQSQGPGAAQDPGRAELTRPAPGRSAPAYNAGDVQREEVVMRVLHAAVALAVLAGVTGPLSAQSLGELAAQEKQKRQGKPAPKVITEQELAKAGKQRGTVSFAGETPAEEVSADASAAEGATEAGTAEAGAGEPGEPGASASGAPAKKEKSEEELRAERRVEWQKAYDTAKEKVRVHQLNVSNIQKDLNDITGGIYTDRRTAVMKMLTDEQAALASAQAELDRLDAEGRSNGWPRWHLGGTLIGRAIERSAEL